MAQTVNILPHAEDRKLLLAIVADRSRPLKHVQRAKIVLHSVERLPVLEVARRAVVSLGVVAQCGRGILLNDYPTENTPGRL